MGADLPVNKNIKKQSERNPDNAPNRGFFPRRNMGGPVDDADIDE
jgi:hypothetical protein